MGHPKPEVGQWALVGRYQTRQERKTSTLEIKEGVLGGCQAQLLGLPVKSPTTEAEEGGTLDSLLRSPGGSKSHVGRKDRLWRVPEEVPKQQVRTHC